MTTTEDFTFPISASPSGAFLDSPPLWRRVGPTSTSETITHNLQRKSFSCLEGGVRDHRRTMESDGHDRMDLLWEDFNDELPKNRNSFVYSSASSSDDDELSEFGCVPMAINLSKGGARGGVGGGKVAMAKNKKISVVVLGKVLKRLFLLQHQSVKRRSW